MFMMMIMLVTLTMVVMMVVVMAARAIMVMWMITMWFKDAINTIDYTMSVACEQSKLPKANYIKYQTNDCSKEHNIRLNEKTFLKIQ